MLSLSLSLCKYDKADGRQIFVEIPESDVSMRWGPGRACVLLARSSFSSVGPSLRLSANEAIAMVVGRSWLAIGTGH